MCGQFVIHSGGSIGFFSFFLSFLELVTREISLGRWVDCRSRGGVGVGGGGG